MIVRRHLEPIPSRFVVVLLLCVAGALALAYGTAGAQTARDDLLAALGTPGHVVLMRHSLAPGSGDPANFDFAVCETQRNLNEAGRAQAASFGDALRIEKIAVSRVYSGRWCRNMDTATLMNLGEVGEAPAFDSQMNLGPGKADEARAFLDALPRDAATVVIVSHASNIRALTGHAADSGEALALRLLPGGGFETLGSLGVIG